VRIKIANTLPAFIAPPQSMNGNGMDSLSPQFGLGNPHLLGRPLSVRSVKFHRFVLQLVLPESIMCMEPLT
jgi:hypothetical protein